MTLELLYIIILLLILGRTKKSQHYPTQKILDEIVLIRTCSLLGEYKKLYNLITNNPQNFIFIIVKKALCNGKTLSNDLMKIENLLYQAQKHYKTNEQFYNLFVFRCVIILVLSLFIRIILKTYFVNHHLLESHAYYDILCVLLAILLNKISLHLLEQHSPKNWFWFSTLSQEGNSWITTYLLDQAQITMSYHQQWSSIHQKMLVSGSNLNITKKKLLTHWAWEKQRADTFKQEKILDLFPVFEIIGFGLPAFLLLLMPCYTLLKA